MALSGKIRRRIFGVLCLAAATAMLLLGSTKLQPGQAHWVFITYWAVCFIFVALAMITAIRDANALRREAREQHRELLERTFQDIESEKQHRIRTGSAPGHSADLRD